LVTSLGASPGDYLIEEEDLPSFSSSSEQEIEINASIEKVEKEREDISQSRKRGCCSSKERTKSLPPLIVKDTLAEPVRKTSYKIILLGESTTGKTSLLMRFVVSKKMILHQMYFLILF